MTNAVGNPNYNSLHPEKRDDEFFIGNFDSYVRVGWETRRPGITAYTIHGKVISNGHPLDVEPVFVKKDEIKKRNIELYNKLELEEQEALALV